MVTMFAPGGQSRLFVLHLARYNIWGGAVVWIILPLDVLVSGTLSITWQIEWLLGMLTHP